MAQLTEQQMFDAFRQELQEIVEEVFAGSRRFDGFASYTPTGESAILNPVHYEDEVRLYQVIDNIRESIGTYRMGIRDNDILEIIDNFSDGITSNLPAEAERQRRENIAENSGRYRNNMLLTAINAYYHTTQKNFFGERQQEGLPEFTQIRNQQRAIEELRRICRLQIRADDIPELTEMVENVANSYLFSLHTPGLTERVRQVTNAAPRYYKA